MAVNNDVLITVSLKDLASSGLSSISKNLQSAGKSASSFGSSISKALGDASETAFKATTVAVAGLGTAIGALGLKGLNMAGDLQMVHIALKTLLGSAEAADKAMVQIKLDAARTPFDLREIARANQALISTGLSAEQARVDVLNLGNAIVGAGGGNEEFSRMIFNLQQIKNLGKASAMDIRQFGYAGLNVYRMLSETTGKTTEQLKDMDITYEMLSESLAKYAEKHKFLDEAANSWNLLKSNLKDVTNIILADIVTGTGVFQFFNQQLGAFVAYLTNNKDQIVGFFVNLGNTLATLYMNFVSSPFFTMLVNTFNALSMWIVANQELVFTFLTGLAIAFGALAVIGGIVFLLNAFLNPLVLITVAIGLLYTAWVTNWGGIQSFFMPIIEGIGTALTATIKYFQDLTAGLNLNKINWEAVGVIMKTAATILTTLVNVSLMLVINSVNALAMVLKVFLAPALNTVIAIFNSWAGSVTTTINLISKLVDWIGKLVSAFKKLPSGASKLINAYGGFATGGLVEANTPVVVGERGAELFVPHSSGRIVPNNQLKSGGSNLNLSVNIGIYAGTETEKRKLAETLYQGLVDLATARNTTVAALMGA